MGELSLIEKLIGIVWGIIQIMIIGSSFPALGSFIEFVTGYDIRDLHPVIQYLEFGEATPYSETKPLDPVVGSIASIFAIAVGLSVYILGSLSAITATVLRTVFIAPSSLEMETLFLITGVGFWATFLTQRYIELYLESIGTCPDW